MKFVVLVVVFFSLRSRVVPSMECYEVKDEEDCYWSKNDESADTPVICHKKNTTAPPTESPSSNSIAPGPITGVRVAPTTELPSAKAPDTQYVMIRVSWIPLSPLLYVTKARPDESANTSAKTADGFDGVFPEFLSRRLKSCGSQFAPTDEYSLDYRSQPSSEHEALYHLWNATSDMAFPVRFTSEQINRRFATFIESPGSLLIMNEDRFQQQRRVVFIKVLAKLCPVLLLSLLSCVLAGIIVWKIDSSSNPEEFPPHFTRGIFDGFWWAFVTMTTVGYGDRAPRSVGARFVAIFWMLLSLVFISVMTATLTSAFTAYSLEGEINIAGVKVGVLKNCLERNEAIRQGARIVVEYDTIASAHTALTRGEEIQAMQIEKLVGMDFLGQSNDDKLFIAKTYRHLSFYGVKLRKHYTLKPEQDYVIKCVFNYIKYRRSDGYTALMKHRKKANGSFGTRRPKQIASEWMEDREVLVFSSIGGLLAVCLCAGLCTQLWCRQQSLPTKSDELNHHTDSKEQVEVVCLSEKPQPHVPVCYQQSYRGGHH